MKEYIERSGLLCALVSNDYPWMHYADAYEIAKNAPIADVVESKRGGWISVKERLPSIHQRVLVWCESKTIQKHVTACTFMADYSGKGKGPYFSRHVRNVTHWMPLPEPPKEG